MHPRSHTTPHWQRPARPVARKQAAEALGIETDLTVDALAQAMVDLNAEHAMSGGCTEDRLIEAGFPRDFLDANKAEATRIANGQFTRQDVDGPFETQGERLVRMREAVAQLLPSREAIVADLKGRGFSRRDTESLLNAAVNFATRDFLQSIRTGAN